MTETNFIIDKKTEYEDILLFVDNTNKKWTVKDKSNIIPKTYSFSDLNEFELCEDGDTIIKGGLGGAIVGGALLGVAGAIVGSNASSKKSKDTCKLIQLRIRVNDLNHPERILAFLNTEHKTTSFVYRQAIEKAKEFTAILSYIQKNNEFVTENIKTDDSIESKIRQIAKLKDDGILSEQEFEEKKKELLSKI